MAGQYYQEQLPIAECYRDVPGTNFPDLAAELFPANSKYNSHENTITIIGENIDKSPLVCNIPSCTCRTSVTIPMPYLPTCALKAKIPWLSRPSKSETVGQGKMDCKLILFVARKYRYMSLATIVQLFDLLSNLQDMTPYYLHKRYHTMDCLSLFQHTKSTGNYWANAVQFIIMNTTLGMKTLQSFDAQLKENHDLLEHPKIYYSNMLKNLYLKTLVNVEDCESAEEFLLEPWILLQLPFEPVILHQWTVALMAEALTFQKKITDFYTMAYPKHLKIAIDKLIRIASLLLNGANTFFTFIAKEIRVKDTSSNHMHAATTLYFEKFQEILPPVLSALKFVLSKECSTIILVLKGMAWSENAEERNCRSNFDFKIIPSIYSHTYWELHQLHKWLFLSPETASEQTISFFHQLAAPKKKFGNLKQLLVNLVEEKIIKPGRLRGEQTQYILNVAAKKGLELVTFYNQYEHYMDFNECAVFDAEKGVIYDILTLQAKVKTEEAIGSITQRLADLVKEEFPSSKIFIDFANSAAPNLKLDEMEERLNTAFFSIDWIYKKLIRRVRATCFSPKRTPLPDRDEMTTEQIAEHFQERIRNLVFKMIEKQYRSLKNGPPYHYHPEIITVQYILPCFAASYLEMESTNESDQAKEEYLQFVHQLIKNYEQHEFCLELGKVKLKQEYFNHNKNFQYCFTTEIERNYENACDALGKIAPFCQQNVVQNSLTHFYAVSKMPSVFCSCQKSGAHVKYDDTWFNQKYMYFNRIHATLFKLGKIPSAPVRYSAALGIVLANLNEEALVLQPNLQNCVAALKVREGLIDAKASGNACCQHFASQRITKIYHEFDRLSDKQLFGLVNFVCFQEWFVRNKTLICTKDFERDYGRQIFPLDLNGKLFWCIVDKDWWKLKILASKSNINKQGDDLSLIPLGLAKSLKRCRDLINSINHKTGKLRTMKEPGAITFFPIKHCRWCGLVKSNTLKLCRECVENLNYPDRNYFCSIECETKCLQHQHTEEHVNFLLMQLNM